MPGNIIIQLWKLEWLTSPESTALDLEGCQVIFEIEAGGTHKKLEFKFSPKQIIIKDSLFMSYKQLIDLNISIHCTPAFNTELKATLKLDNGFPKNKGPSPIKLIFTHEDSVQKFARLYADIQIIDNEPVQVPELPIASTFTHFVLEKLTLVLTDATLKQTVSMFDLIIWTEGVCERHGDPQIVRNNSSLLSKIAVPRFCSDKNGKKSEIFKIDFKAVSRKAGTHHTLTGTYDLRNLSPSKVESVYAEVSMVNQSTKITVGSISFLVSRSSLAEGSPRQGPDKSRGLFTLYSTTIKLSSDGYFGKNKIKLSLGKQNKYCLINNPNAESVSWIEKCEFKRSPNDTILYIQLINPFNSTKVAAAELVLYGLLDGTRYCSKMVSLHAVGNQMQTIGVIRFDLKFCQEASLQLPLLK